MTACGGGGGGGGGTPPTTPSVVVTSVTISGSTDMLKVRESVTFTATATHSDGSNAAVTQWSTDAVSVMTVDAVTGSATGVAAGKATLIASHDGVVGTRLIRVVPDYQGTWSGSYRVSSCSDTGDYTTFGWCNTVRGQVLPLTLSLSQTRDTVSGTITIYEYTGATSGPIADNGVITLSGTAVNGNASMTITKWSTTAASPGLMTGSFSIRNTSTDLSGSAEMNCDITTMQKSAMDPGVGLDSPRWGSSVLSIGDALRAMGVRR
ncbi:MAG: Ig-like domain-containing protein [Acidobacteria bacterium]|nr:Ig-like domain-containing protein [Acidobacteriota bacterium]